MELEKLEQALKTLLELANDSRPDEFLEKVGGAAVEMEPVLAITALCSIALMYRERAHHAISRLKEATGD